MNVTGKSVYCIMEYSSPILSLEYGISNKQKCVKKSIGFY